jgi:hypothetical protein
LLVGKLGFSFLGLLLLGFEYVVTNIYDGFVVATNPNAFQPGNQKPLIISLSILFGNLCFDVADVSPPVDPPRIKVTYNFHCVGIMFVVWLWLEFNSFTFASTELKCCISSVANASNFELTPPDAVSFWDRWKKSDSVRHDYFFSNIIEL